MTLSEVVSFLPRVGRLVDAERKESSKNNSSLSAAPKAGTRVREAMKEMATGDQVLAQLREIIAGPYQRLAEARFEEMLDILSEQDDFVRGKFASLETGMTNLSEVSAKLSAMFGMIDEKIDTLADKTSQDKSELRADLDKAMARVRGDFELKMQAISDTLKKCVDDVEAETRREILALTTTVDAHMAETAGLSDKVQTASMTALETRIAQWRAEIEDDRKQDLQDVANSLVDIGQRLMALRGPQLG